jgi:hypothetical protein
VEDLSERIEATDKKLAKLRGNPGSEAYLQNNVKFATDDDINKL